MRVAGRFVVGVWATSAASVNLFFDFCGDVPLLYPAGASVWGERLDYVVRDFVRALEPLMSIEDVLKVQRGVGGILINRRSPVVDVGEGVLRVYCGVKKSGGRYVVGSRVWMPVFGRGGFLLYYAGEGGGLFVADVLGRDVRRWTNVGAAGLLRRGGFLDWSLEWGEAGGVVCGVLRLTVDGALRGVFGGAWGRLWRLSLVGVALLQELYDRGFLVQYSAAPGLSKGVGVVDLWHRGEPLPQVVNVKFPSEVGRDDPDALGLMQDGRRVLWLEVSKVEGGTFEDLYRGFRGKLGRLVEEGLFDGRRFTRRGVALVGLAVDAGSGATVEAPLAERYGALEHAAYPRVESQILRWHRALDRSVGVAPLFATYRDLGRQLAARFVLLDDVPKSERDLKSAVERCFR
mgnify:CR=1 FL=1